jgi:hypothetical protein
MNCFTAEQLQLYMDGELPSKLIAEYKQHLAGCVSCSQRFSEQHKLAQSVKTIINGLAKNPDTMKDFNNTSTAMVKPNKTRNIPLWIKVAAILVPAAISWCIYESRTEAYEPTPENILTYDMCNGIDANTAWQENLIVTTVTDKNGKVVECSAK